MAASINKGRTARGVSETAEKLANMSIGTRRQSLGQTRPPPMKAGVNWISESGNLLRSGQQIPTERTLTRKVAGWDDDEKKYLLTLDFGEFLYDLYFQCANTKLLMMNDIWVCTCPDEFGDDFCFYYGFDIFLWNIRQFYIWLHSCADAFVSYIVVSLMWSAQQVVMT